MSKFAKNLILVLSILVIASSAFASITFDPTKVALGARPIGMGGAFVGKADDVNSIFKNSN